jgi:bifunctional non-homologous end joining protein LigD
MNPVIKRYDLEYRQGSSDKVYHIQVVQVGPGPGLYDVLFQYGRRGSTLQSGQKNAAPIPLSKATAFADSLAAEKRKKGYTDMASSGATQIPAPPQPSGPGQTGPLPQLLNPVKDERELGILLISPQWFMQEKMDGERRLVKIDRGVVTAYNRSGALVPFHQQLVGEIIKRFIGHDNRVYILDCELVGDFLHVFDVTDETGILQMMTFEQRLQQIPLDTQETPSSRVLRVRVAKNTLDKRNLLEEVRKRGGEGVVFKKSDSAYRPGRPNSGGNQLKYKLYETAVVAVSAVNAQRSVEMKMYKGSGKDMQIVGNVTIPQNASIPDVDDLIEVRYLYACRGGSLFQPVFLRRRTDVSFSDSMSTLKYKGEPMPEDAVKDIASDPVAILAW